MAIRPAAFCGLPGDGLAGRPGHGVPGTGWVMIIAPIACDGRILMGNSMR